MLNTNAQQGNCFSLVARRVSGVEALTDDFGWDPGFWLCYGDATHECHSRGQAGCDVQRHNRRIGKGVGVVQYHLKLSDVFILAIAQLNDLRALDLSECSAR
jgi:hypothetical protein